MFVVVAAAVLKNVVRTFKTLAAVVVVFEEGGACDEEEEGSLFVVVEEDEEKVMVKWPDRLGAAILQETSIKKCDAASAVARGVISFFLKDRVLSGCCCSRRGETIHPRTHTRMDAHTRVSYHPHSCP